MGFVLAQVARVWAVFTPGWRLMHVWLMATLLDGEAAVAAGLVTFLHRFYISITFLLETVEVAQCIFFSPRHFIYVFPTRCPKTSSIMRAGALPHSKVWGKSQTGPLWGELQSRSHWLRLYRICIGTQKDIFVSVAVQPPPPPPPCLHTAS